jgi:hypothetical protein
LASDEPTYTAPWATAGEDWMGPPVAAVHSGAQVVGLPLQLVTPSASKA